VPDGTWIGPADAVRSLGVGAADGDSLVLGEGVGLTDALGLGVQDAVALGSGLALADAASDGLGELLADADGVGVDAVPGAVQALAPSARPEVTSSARGRRCRCMGGLLVRVCPTLGERRTRCLRRSDAARRVAAPDLDSHR
jgi:hypothetical protein